MARSRRRSFDLMGEPTYGRCSPRPSKGVNRARGAMRTKEGTVVWGMTLETFTAVHVVLSLIGIVAGFVVLFSFFKGKRLRI